MFPVAGFCAEILHTGRRGAAALLLLFAACAEPRTGAVDENAPPREATGRLPELAFPKAYRLRLKIPPLSNRFWGKAAIDLGVPRPTRWVVLHARGLKIEAVSVEDRDGRVQQGRWYVRSAWDFKLAQDELVLSFDEPVTDGATLTIDYEGRYRHDARGMYKVEAGGASVVLTQFEPTDARSVFPCFDEPRYRTPFEITVAVPKGDQAFSNAPLARVVTGPRGEAYVTYEFSPTPPLPTYLVAVAAGPFEVASARTGSTSLR